MNQQKINSLILDMDGVLWKADIPIGNLPEIFSHIHKSGIKVAFATNNGSRTPEQYIDRLNNFGVSAEPWQIFTSALAVAEIVSEKFPSAKVFAIGETGLLTALQNKGLKLLDIEDAPAAQVLVMGLDRKINYEKMSAAALLVARDVPFFATNSDKTFPTPDGEIPGAGAWISVVVTATGKSPIYAGKPAAYLLNLARQSLGTDQSETLVVGDRLETDIAGGQNAKMPVALVLSGVSTIQEARNWEPAPDFVFRDLQEVVAFVSSSK